MEFLTSEERSVHYLMRLKAIKEDISSARTSLQNAVSSIDDGWTGQVAQTCRDKLETVSNELKNASNELTAAEKKITKTNNI